MTIFDIAHTDNIDHINFCDKESCAINIDLAFSIIYKQQQAAVEKYYSDVGDSMSMKSTISYQAPPISMMPFQSTASSSNQ